MSPSWFDSLFSAMEAKRGLALIACLSLSACLSPRHPSTPSRPAMEDPASVRDRFQRALPESFRVVDSVVFKFRGRTLSGIGFLSVNQPQRSFQLACMTGVGVTLFEISGLGDEISCHFAMEDLRRGGDLAHVVGLDIQRTCFDMCPTSEADVRVKKETILFRETRSGGRVEWVFSKPQALLAEKRFFEGSRLVSVVRYTDYRELEGRLFPATIAIQNRKYRYRLTVRLKEVQEIR